MPLFDVLEQLLDGRQPLVDPEQLDMHRLGIHPLAPESQPEHHDQRKPDHSDIHQRYAEADNDLPGTSEHWPVPSRGSGRAIKGARESAIISGVSRISKGCSSKWRRDFPSSV